MKTIQLKIYVVIACVTLTILSSCSNNPPQSKDVAQDQNQQKFTSNTGKDDAQLLVDLVAAQYQEIHLSKYALGRSDNANVKTIAGMMITDHSAFLNALTSLAAQKSVSVPNEDSTAVNQKIDSWKDKKPLDFNKGWTDDMIAAHKDAIDKIQKAIDNANTDPDIKNLLSSTLPTVRKHLDMLTDCKTKLDNLKH